MLDNNSTSANKRIAKNTLYLYFRMFFVLVISLYTTRIVISALGVEDFGVYSVIGGFVAMFGFLNSTLSSGINRFYNYEIGKRNEEGVIDVYVNAIIIQLSLAIILFCLIELLGLWYIKTKMIISIDRLLVVKWLLHFSLISLVFTILQVPFSAAVLAFEKMNYYALVSIIDVILKLLIAIYISNFNGERLWIYGFLIMLISIGNFILYFLYVKTHFPALKLRLRVNRPLFMSMLSFSGWSFLNPLAYTSRSHGCNLILNSYFGPIVNAAYAITNQVASAVDSFSMSVSVAARPQLIQSYSSGNYERFGWLFYITSKIMFALISMLVVPLIFNMDFVLHLWLGNSIPSYTSNFCILILLVKLVDSLNPSATNAIMATGKIKIYMIVSSIIILLIIPISILSFSKWDNPTLLFFIMLICTIINQIASIYIVSNTISQIKLLHYLRYVIIPCTIHFGIVYFFVSLSFMLFAKGNFLISILTSFVASILFTYLLLLNKRERSMVCNFIGKKYYNG